MELVVLNVAYPFMPVGPDALGGPEKMLAELDAALVRSGHESFVMACEGSVTNGILIATPRPSGLLEDAERQRIHEQYRFTLQTFVEKWPIDLIHMHGADFYEYLPATGVPVLVTLHLPIDQYPEKIFHLERPQTFLQCVSARQRCACPPCGNLLPDIDNDFAPGQLFSAPGIERLFSLYEQLVGESRALTRINAAHTGTVLAAEGIQA
jgi:hypothetical protein